MHELFANRFGEIAEAETRVIHVIGNEMDLPPGNYPVFEFYCTDNDCDCRQVYLHIVNHHTQQEEAVISFGWEPLDFYKRWNHGFVDHIIRDFKGPSLATVHTQGKYARQWLLYVKNWLRSDKKYVKRLERHYRLMKQSIRQQQGSL